MNDSLYEDYMRSVLGYQLMNDYTDTYNYNNYDNYSSYDVIPTMAHMQNQGTQMMNNMMPMQNQNMQSMSTRPMTAMNNIQIQELEKCYPEIYQKVDSKVDTRLNMLEKRFEFKNTVSKSMAYWLFFCLNEMP